MTAVQLFGTRFIANLSRPARLKTLLVALDMGTVALTLFLKHGNETNFAEYADDSLWSTKPNQQSNDYLAPSARLSTVLLALRMLTLVPALLLAWRAAF
jgi:hypothetical protein